MECENNGLDEQRENSESLEGILNQKVTLDTDIMDFFLIAGWGKWYRNAPVYERAEPDLQKEIKNYLKSERSKLESSDKLRRTRIARSAELMKPWTF